MKKMNRRSFMKSVGKAGVISFAAWAGDTLSNASPDDHEVRAGMTVPKKVLGRTGMKVSMLGLGGSQDLMSKKMLMKQALKLGVTYWDTARTYRKSEEAIGNYFTAYPNDRKKVFLVTKTKSSSQHQMTKDLTASLRELKTDYVDMFFIHSVSNVEKELTNNTKAWVEKEKKKGRIRFFGFSTHKNMAPCLATGSALGWVDGIMSSYNYRFINDDNMNRAIDRCVRAGIGLVAMKTQAPFMSGIYADLGKDDKTDHTITEQFIKKGFTVEQAKLKAVWENRHIVSICSEMTNMAILKANAAASIDKTALSNMDKRLLDFHARQTSSFYCTGCAEFCENQTSCDIPISDVIRCVMYAREYNESDRARRILRQMSPNIITLLSKTDYTSAEKACPNKLPIAIAMKEAVKILI